MSNKQSNNQSVKGVVNNKINCCDDKKKKRKPRKKQQPQEQQPVDEFPVLNTQINSRYPQGGISHMAVRNTVYIPNAMQITPEGIQQNVPEYFNRHYTNLVRTMEDFRTSMMNEMQDVKNLVSIQPPNNSMATQTVNDMGSQTVNDINTEPYYKEEPNSASFSQSSSPVKSLINTFENFNINDNPEDEYVPFEEKPFVAKSPKQNNLYKEFERLYKDRDDMIQKRIEQGKKDIEEQIKRFAESIGVSLTSETGRRRSVQQLRKHIEDKINSIT